MYLTKSLFLGSIISLLAFMAGCTRVPTIRVNEQKGRYTLTGPNRQVILSIPKGSLSWKEFRQEESTYNPNYFHFEDKVSNLMISGRFAPGQKSSGIGDFWAQKIKEWKRRDLSERQDVLFVKIVNWNAIIYDISIANGYSSHIRAYWLQEGTRIDIHLSMTSDCKDVRLKPKLWSLLRRMQVNVKNDDSE